MDLADRFDAAIQAHELEYGELPDLLTVSPFIFLDDPDTLQVWKLGVSTHPFIRDGEVVRVVLVAQDASLDRGEITTAQGYQMKGGSKNYYFIADAGEPSHDIRASLDAAIKIHIDKTGRPPHTLYLSPENFETFGPLGDDPDAASCIYRFTSGDARSWYHRLLQKLPRKVTGKRYLDPIPALSYPVRLRASTEFSSVVLRTEGGYRHE